MLASIHETLGWTFVWAAGLTGVFGVVLSLLKRGPNRVFWSAVVGSFALGVVQVSLGLVMFGRGQNPGDFHVFYGTVLLFTVAFAYVYKSQLAKRPTLYWGILMLFAMGVGLRGISNFGRFFAG